MKIVLERTALKKDDRLADFLTDAYATVGIAYHRAAGVYTMDKEMQELGTAAVHRCCPCVRKIWEAWREAPLHSKVVQK